MNFAVSPEKTNVPSITDDYIVACEKACWKLPKGEASALRAELVGTLKSSKAPKSNISKDERHAIKDLQKQQSIMILPADKGKATVIIDKEEYNSKLTSMLSDTNTYTKLKKDPMAAYKKETCRHPYQT